MLELRHRIEKARSGLAAMPDGPVYRDVRAGNDRATCEIDAWRDVLLIMDGGRFGVIDLWSSDELAAYQSTPLPVDRAAGYFIIGQIIYEPLVIARSSGDVLWLVDAFTDIENAPIVRLGQPIEFLTHSVFGPGYGDLDAPPSPWFSFLRDQVME